MLTIYISAEFLMTPTTIALQKLENVQLTNKIPNSLTNHHPNQAYPSRIVRSIRCIKEYTLFFVSSNR